MTGEELEQIITTAFKAFNDRFYKADYKSFKAGFIVCMALIAQKDPPPPINGKTL